MGNGLSDSSGLRIIEEDSAVDVVRQERIRSQQERMRGVHEAGMNEETEEDIVRFYGTRNNYEDLTDSVAEVVREHAPEQESQVKAMLRRYRGMEEKMYEALEGLFGRRPNFQPVDFDLELLPYKGNMQTASTNITSASQWVRQVSGHVTKAQAKVRDFLAQKRAQRARTGRVEEAKSQPFAQAIPAGAAGSGAAEEKGAPAKVHLQDVERTDSQDSVASLQLAAVPAVVAVPDADAAPKPKTKARRVASRRRKKSSNLKQQLKKEKEVQQAKSTSTANITVSNHIKKALDESQISAELLFFMHDDKNTGRIDNGHFLLLCRQDLHITPDVLSDDQIASVFTAIDLSGDGEIQLDELENFLALNAQLAEDTI